MLLDIYPSAHVATKNAFILSLTWVPTREVIPVNRNFDPFVSFDTACTAREIQVDAVISDLAHTDSQLISQNLPIKSILASTYLCEASSYVNGLMTSKNFNDIVTIARYFPGNLTSFLGFECRLGNNTSRSDWAFAVSGVGNDRLVLNNFLKSSHNPAKFLSHPEWQNITAFTESWVDTSSPLAGKIQCFWLEFDMPNESPEISVPSIFFGPVRLPGGIKSNDVEHYEWLIELALPLLKGRDVSAKMKHQMHRCIENIPSNATLFQIGTMLSRESKSVRFHINKLDPIQIIPYLEAIGWHDETGELSTLIGELADKVDRFVISYDIFEDGIGPRIGIELSFTQGLEEQFNSWNILFSYFVEKGWCLPERRDALLNYPGTDDEEYFNGSVMKPVITAAEDMQSLLSSSIVRYINHAKLVFEQGKGVEAKAYPAVRLFSNS